MVRLLLLAVGAPILAAKQWTYFKEREMVPAVAGKGATAEASSVLSGVQRDGSDVTPFSELLSSLDVDGIQEAIGMVADEGILVLNQQDQPTESASGDSVGLPSLSGATVEGSSSPLTAGLVGLAPEMIVESCEGCLAEGTVYPSDGLLAAGETAEVPGAVLESGGGSWQAEEEEFPIAPVPTRPATEPVSGSCTEEGGSGPVFELSGEGTPGVARHLSVDVLEPLLPPSADEGVAVCRITPSVLAATGGGEQGERVASIEGGIAGAQLAQEHVPQQVISEAGAVPIAEETSSNDQGPLQLASQQAPKGETGARSPDPIDLAVPMSDGGPKAAVVQPQARQGHIVPLPLEGGASRPAGCSAEGTVPVEAADVSLKAVNSATEAQDTLVAPARTVDAQGLSMEMVEGTVRWSAKGGEADASASRGGGTSSSAVQSVSQPGFNQPDTQSGHTADYLGQQGNGNTPSSQSDGLESTDHNPFPQQSFTTTSKGSHDLTQPLPFTDVSSPLTEEPEVGGASKEEMAGWKPSTPREPISDQIIRQLNLQLYHRRGGSEATISLHPKQLGRLRAELVIEDGKVRAQFTAETATVKCLIDAESSQLRAGFEKQGLALEEFSVLVAPDFSGGHGGMRSKYPSLGWKGSRVSAARTGRALPEGSSSLARWVMSAEGIDIVV